MSAEIETSTSSRLRLVALICDQNRCFIETQKSKQIKQERDIRLRMNERERAHRNEFVSGQLRPRAIRDQGELMKAPVMPRQHLE